MNRSTDLYVRHAMAQARDDLGPELWRLGPEGRAAALDLAAAVKLNDPPMLVLTSTEPKAAETAAPLAERLKAPLVLDERLREVDRPWVGSGYRAAVHGYLAGNEPDGWEPREHVAERMASAVEEGRHRVFDAPLAVVGHGLALAIHMAQVLPRGFDPGQFWSRMSFPDAWLLDRTELLIVHAQLVA